MPPAIISGFEPGDIIDITSAPYDSSGGATFFESGNLLEVVEGGVAYDLQFDPSQVFSGGFSLSPDASGSGTDVTLLSSAVTGYSTSATLPAGGSASGLTVNDPSPYASVCFITLTLPATAAEGVSRATGFIIGPHTILTAAHVVASVGVSGAGLATNIQVYPGVAQTTSENSALTVLSIQADPDYVPSADGTSSPSNSQYDFAIITVAQNLDSYGAFSLGSGFTGGVVNETGYPAIPNGFSDYNQANTQYNDIGNVTVDPYFPVLLYGSLAPIVAYPGDSGSPLWTYSGSTIDAVGLVSTTGYAVQFTAQDDSAIEAWVAAAASNGFSEDISSGPSTISAAEALYGPVITGQGSLVVDAGGAANSATIGSGGEEFVSGADADATITAGGLQEVLSGGDSMSARVESGGVQTISAGGSATDSKIAGLATIDGAVSYAMVSAGGIDSVYAGGSAIATLVLSGGEEIVASGGLASATTVQAGGVETIYAGASAIDVTIGYGGVVEFISVVASGATASVTSTVTDTFADATEYISGVTLSYGAASEPAYDVLSGGVLDINSGVAAPDVTVSNGGTLSGGGDIQGETLLDFGLIDNVS
jgi:autotransporter passenger strand-loop-strand repeat protein